MPLYADMYHSYIGGGTPTSYSQVYNLPSYSSSTYTPSYTPSPRITSVPRYLPKLTTISETPLSKHRLAALSRLSSPKITIVRRLSPKYVAPRPRRIDTSDIDVSAQRFANRRISEVKAKEITEVIPELQKDESVDDIHMKGRSTIRRDRGLVRLKTTRMRSKSPPPVVEKVKKIEQIKIEPIKIEDKPVDIDMGYGSSERSSSGSWRNMFEGELDLYDKKVISPTTKTPGENFFEKYRIKDTESINNMHYLTIDDLPMEKRDSVRRRSGGKLPSFKEICSDISSDKLTDDLNAGELRRRASLIIEEEINKIRQSESGTILCTLLQEAQPEPEDIDSDKRKSRKVKKIRQKITAKTSIENHEPVIKAVIASVEIEMTAFEVKPSGVSVVVEVTDEVDNKVIKLPLRPKKKLTAVESKTTCDDPIVSPPSPPLTAMSKEMKTNEMHEAAIINIKTKNADLDLKLLLDKDEVKDVPGELMMKSKKVVKSKPSVKTEAPKMNALRKDLSADDFWGMMGSRETTVFSRRKQQVIEEQQKNIVEHSWEEDEEAEESQLKKIAIDKTKTSAATETSPKNAALDLNSRLQTIENKSESLRAIEVDKEKISQNKSKLNEKVENVSSVIHVANKSKVSEPKVEQKGEENVTKINKSLDAPKADKVSEENASLSEKKKINENVSPKPKEDQQEEKPLKLQPVPKPSKTNLATQKIEKVEMKVDEKEKAPKSPPWKLKKAEEKLPEAPKTPPWKKALADAKIAPKVETKIEPKDEPAAKSKIEVKVAQKLEPKVEPKAEVGKIEPKNMIKVEEEAPKIKIEPKWKKIETKLELKPELKKIESKPEPKVIEIEPKEETPEVLPKAQLELKASEEKPKILPDSKIDKPNKVDIKFINSKLEPKRDLKITCLKKDPKVATVTTVEPPKPIEVLKLVETPKPKVIEQPKPEPPKAVPKPSPEEKKEQSKLKDKIPDVKPKPLATKSIKTSDQKLSTDDKSKVNPSEVKKTEIKSDTLCKSSATVQSPKSPATKVNDQDKKKPQEICEGQKLEKADAKVLNETKNTPETLNSDEPKLVSDSSKKSFGTLSKFPTLNNLNSIDVNEASADNQQSSNENKTIEKSIAKDSQINAISVAIESSKASNPPDKEESSESESEEESESSYESESSVEMEKKKFDPQRKMKLDVTQMKKCYGGKDEKIVCTLVARPRPLWKIKRNRNAVFSDSESGSSGEDETRSTGGGSASGSSQSSGNSEKLKKKVGSGKSGGVEVSSDNITALMPVLSVNEEIEGDDNGDSETKKKNRLSTSSADSGFCGIGATAAKSPRKALGKFKVESPV